MILHPGGAKTGSSALQNFLFSHSSLLKSLGFSYVNGPVPSHAFEITSGNGLGLVDALMAENPTPKLIDQCIDTYFDGLDKAIVSSEVFESLPEKGWQLLRERCSALNIRIKIIFFVRNVVPLAVSAYDQIVKRHGEWGDINDWIKDFSWSHYETLTRIAGLFSNNDIKVVSYDVECANLYGSFLAELELGNNAYLFDAVDSTKIVNRSLSENERDCLRLVNKQFGALYSRDLSDRFIYSRPKLQAEPEVISDASILFLEEKFKEAVGWINASFFFRDAIVSVCNPKIDDKNNKIGSNRVGMGDAMAKEILIEWLLEKLSSAHHEIVQTFCHSLMSVDWDNAGHPLIPVDFDPFAYLLKNPDLINFGVRPYQHYIDYGRDEGRGYTWTA